MTQIIKSVHIEGCWPYQYVKPISKEKNAKERERYWKKKAASVKTLNGKKLLKLTVYSMSDDFCKELNNGTR